MPSAFDVTSIVLARKQPVQLLLERGDRLLDDDVVLQTLIVTPQDQTDRPRRLAINEDLARQDDGRIRDRRDWSPRSG